MNHRYHSEISRQQGTWPNALPTIVDANSYLEERFNSGEPLSLGKMGGTEGKILQFMTNWFIRNMRPLKSKRYMSDLYNLSGVYPNTRTTLYKFYTYWKHHVLPDVDTLCHWRGHPDSVIDQRYSLNAQYIKYNDFFLDAGATWPNLLDDKRILVISPFKDTIEYQSDKLGRVWNNQFSISKMTLAGVIRSPHYAHLEAPQTPNWFVQLESLWGQTLAFDYDVLIVGAGAWGLPLANMAKAAGKIGVHMGGEAQLLFGIKGRRWQSGNKKKTYINDKWIYPLDTDTPKDFSKVTRHFKDDNTYWK